MPALSYYQANEGSWTGPFRLRVHDRSALAEARGWLEAAGWTLLSWTPGLAMSTTVSVDSPTQVRHSTRVHWGPLSMMWGEEVLELHGSGLTMTGWSATALGMRDVVEATGTVDEASTLAHYELRWLGMEVHQSGEIVPEGVVLRQRGPGFTSEARLRRD